MRSNQAGFTLIEMIVAIALFAIVMVVAVDAMLALVAADKKAQALQSIMNNLNITLDSMVRNIRMGSHYYCGSGLSSGTADCGSSGSNEVTFTCNTTIPGCDPANDRWIYKWDDGSNSNDCVPVGETAICKYTQGKGWEALTSSDVDITYMNFNVSGSTAGDSVQPKVIMLIKGQAGGGSVKTQSTFDIEATAVQRELDL